MLSHELAIELEPELLNRVGPRGVRWQAQETNLAMNLGQMIHDVAMKMVRPGIQSDVNDICLRIVLLDMIKEPVHLLHVETPSSSNQHLSGCNIERSGQSHHVGGGSRGFGSFVS